ncbi:MAG: DUF433 domain-containing protein [Pyrinomonadaceae bacterium]|nr:DUF433 domain-containing protein [Pyrinomonadaceae bacterium]
MDTIAERITIDPDMLNGKPAIRGTRIAVQTILEFLGNGDGFDEILANYPSLEKEDIFACLKFASGIMQNKYEIETVMA